MKFSERLRTQVRKIKPLVVAVRAIRIAVDPVRRTAWMIGRRSPDLLMQPFPTTSFDRHPGLFGFVKVALASIESPRVLSYGCSSGEEAISLARAMPKAFVKGIDINPVSIKMADKLRRRQGLGNVAFAVGQSPFDEAPEAYDAVFCLSVLRHGALEGGRPENCSSIMPFSKFETMVAGLDRCLKPGGYLVLWGCHFRFADAAASRGYEVILTMSRREGFRGALLYGRDNLRLQVDFDGECIFRKKAGGEAAKSIAT